MLPLFYRWRNRLWKVKGNFQSSIASKQQSRTSNPDLNAISLCYTHTTVSPITYIFWITVIVLLHVHENKFGKQKCVGKKSVTVSALLCTRTAAQLIVIIRSHILQSQHNAAIANTEPLFLQELQVRFLPVFGCDIIINWSIYNLDLYVSLFKDII